MNKIINNSRVKSIILTGAILCSFTQTSLSSPKFYNNLKTISALSGVFFGLTIFVKEQIKEFKLIKTNKALLNSPKTSQEKTDFVKGKYSKTVLISQI